MGVENCFGETAAFGRERTPERPQTPDSQYAAFVREFCEKGGKHRTEATEVTEGEIGWGVEN
jgi:hypothetical protein